MLWDVLSEIFHVMWLIVSVFLPYLWPSLLIIIVISIVNYDKVLAFFLLFMIPSFLNIVLFLFPTESFKIAMAIMEFVMITNVIDLIIYGAMSNLSIWWDVLIVILCGISMCLYQCYLRINP